MSDQEDSNDNVSDTEKSDKNHDQCIPCSFHAPECLPQSLIPEWYQPNHISRDITVAKAFTKNEFLTPTLIAEIQNHFPQSNSINCNNNNRRSKEDFAKNTEELFPIGRIFFNREQFYQAAKMFCSKWAVHISHQSKTIKCFYHLDKRNRKKEPIFGQPSRKSNGNQLKKEYACPFIIRYRYLNYCKNKVQKYPDIFYRIKITSAHYHHTCSLDVSEQRQALTRSTGVTYKLDLMAMTNVVLLLRETPTLSNNILRKLLRPYLPDHFSLCSSFLRNFKLRVSMYLLRFPTDHEISELTVEEASNLLKSTDIAANEMIDFDDPLIKLNFSAMLQKVFKSSDGTWDAIQYLEQLMEECPGIDYRICRSSHGSPKAICWITPKMRHDLLRFGTVLSLDGQKKQYNKFNWPYIGPVVKDGENRVRVVCESLLVSEDREGYVFVLNSLAEMEPRWCLSSLKFIFADHLFNIKILRDLKIEDTCVLRGDHYHLLQEVWPKFFGQTVFRQISFQLETLLNTEDEKSWDDAFSSAVHVCSNDAQKMQYLEDIHNNPQYYSQWWLSRQEGHLMYRGSVAAEQNHASIHSRLGEGGNFSIVEHIQLLMKRQQDLTTERTALETKHLTLIDSYKSRQFPDSESSSADVHARQSFTGYAYKELFLREFKLSNNYEVSTSSDEKEYIVRHKSKTENYYSFPINGRCNCKQRMGYMLQCRHEIAVRGFRLDQWNHRWYNSRCFDKSQSNLSTRFSHSVHLPNVTNNQTYPEENCIDDNSQDYSIEETEEELGRMTKKIPTFSELQEKCSNLIRLLQGSTKLNYLSYIVDVISDRAQHGFDFSVTFDFNNKENNHPDSNCRPILGKIVANKTASKSKRLKSMQERIRDRSSKRPKSITQTFINNDSQHITAGHTTRRSCSICQGSGHRRDTCPKIYCFGVPPLPFNDKHSRNQLISDLQSIDTFPCYVRDEKDERSISKSAPKFSNGVVIHNRYFSNRNMSHFSITNICLECTILSSRGAIPMPMFQKALFDTSAITTWISRSTSNVIVNLLKRNNIDSLLSQQRFGMSQEVAMVASQLSQRSSDLTKKQNPTVHCEMGNYSDYTCFSQNTIDASVNKNPFIQSLLSFSQSQNNVSETDLIDYSNSNLNSNSNLI